MFKIPCPASQRDKYITAMPQIMAKAKIILPSFLSWGSVKKAMPKTNPEKIGFKTAMARPSQNHFFFELKVIFC